MKLWTQNALFLSQLLIQYEACFFQYGIPQENQATTAYMR